MLGLETPSKLQDESVQPPVALVLIEVTACGPAPCSP
jgi:hypothetical protein